MTKMGRLKKGDIFNRIAYELFGVKIGEDEEVVPSAGVSAKPDSKHPAPQQKFAPAAPVAEPAKPVPAVATTYIAPGTELTGTLKTDSNVEICGSSRATSSAPERCCSVRIITATSPPSSWS